MGGAHGLLVWIILVWVWSENGFVFSFGFLFFFWFGFGSMYYTDVCNALAIKCAMLFKLMPNKIYVMFCFNIYHTEI